MVHPLFLSPVSNTKNTTNTKIIVTKNTDAEDELVVSTDDTTDTKDQDPALIRFVCSLVCLGCFFLILCRNGNLAGNRNGNQAGNGNGNRNKALLIWTGFTVVGGTVAQVLGDNPGIFIGTLVGVSILSYLGDIFIALTSTPKEVFQVAVGSPPMSYLLENGSLLLSSASWVATSTYPSLAPLHPSIVTLAHLCTCALGLFCIGFAAHKAVSPIFAQVQALACRPLVGDGANGTNPIIRNAFLVGVTASLQTWYVWALGFFVQVVAHLFEQDVLEDAVLDIPPPMDIIPAVPPGNVEAGSAENVGGLAEDGTGLVEDEDAEAENAGLVEDAKDAEAEDAGLVASLDEAEDVDEAEDEVPEEIIGLMDQAEDTGGTDDAANPSPIINRLRSCARGHDQ